MALLGNNNIIQQQHFKSNYAFYGSPGFSNSPGVSTGTQAFTFNFTPKSSSSEIYIESSIHVIYEDCLLYTSPSPRDSCASRMPSSA